MIDAASAGVSDVRTRRAVEFLLHALTHRLRMDGAFFARMTDTEQIHLVTNGVGAATFKVRPGDRLPRLDSYCHHVVERDASWLIRDTSVEPLVCDLAGTAQGGIAAYLGVPVRDPDGEVFGTLCCMHHSPREDLGEQDVAVAEALAEILGLHLAQLEEGQANLGELSARVAQLTDVVETQELQLEVYRRMVDANHSVTLLLDLDTLQVEYANITACELVGRERSALLGRPPWELHGCFEQLALRRELAPLQDPGAWPVTYHQPAVDGAPAMDVQAQRFTSTSGRACILWHGHDIATYQESAERLAATVAIEQEAAEQLRRVDRLRAAFLTAVSHELRTPLTVLKGTSELLRSGRHQPDATPELLDRLAVHADRLDRLLTDLLDLNRSTHGSLELRREPVDLAELVRRAVTELELGDHPVAFDLAPIDLDLAPVKVERIVANLVLNAAVHTPAGTPIEVAVTPRADGALLTVTDRGEGIAPQDRERIFQPFHQGERVLAHRPGTGIGLSLVAAFAELHGGSAWVEEAEGGGSAFHVLLPRAAPEPAVD
ncbi:MAG: GAF domain-containing sensor histidine kinase [Nitriliruptoraceae bacterium]|nr:GAF domain-containing sensor histidine kinase [Nitriliruptoraceae bacterium]